jgi:D-alanine-D-alanine ligase
VWEALESRGHEVLPIAITPHAGMVRYPGTPADLRAVDLPVIDDGPESVVIPCDPDRPGVVIDGEFHAIDVVFPVLHGPWGEDGTIQGLLELAGVPYVGSGVLASALCMDKITLKTVLRAAGITVSDWVAIDGGSDVEDALTRALGLGSVVFVKPSRAGSSVGISRIDVQRDGRPGLMAAIESARAHDPRVIIEAGVLDAREIECGVRQTADGSVDASTCAEIAIRDGFDFYDFNAKYISDGADLIVPAEIGADTVEKVRAMARRCFLEVGCEGLARVDFFVRGEDIVVNEVNTMPGFTPISMFPRMWEASGVEYTELVDSLVAQALSRPTGLR